MRKKKGDPIMSKGLDSSNFGLSNVENSSDSINEAGLSGDETDMYTTAKKKIKTRELDLRGSKSLEPRIELPEKSHLNDNNQALAASSTQRRVFETRYYGANHVTPFSLMAIYNDPSAQKKRIHQSSIGDTLMSIDPKGDFIVKNVGFNKFTIVTNNLTSANSLVNNPLFTQKHINVFIPFEKYVRKAIIKGVPLDVDLQLFKQNAFSGHIEIKNIRRLNKKKRKL